MTSKKTFLLDMDGLVVLRDKVFSVRVSERLNISIDTVLPFFKNEFQECLVGKADLKQELVKYVAKWGWEGSIDELLNFWFDGEKEINHEIIDKVSELRGEGIKVYLATNNEKYRVNFLWNDVGLNKYFDGIFSSAEIGLKKPDPEFYMAILKLLKVNSEDIIFMDDDIENVKSAEEIGIDSRLYSGISDFKVV